MSVFLVIDIRMQERELEVANPFESLTFCSEISGITFYCNNNNNNNNNNNTNNNKLQVVCHLVAVVTLHVYKI